MLKKIFFSFFILISINLQIFSQIQEDFCSSPAISDKKFQELPWYGNNQYLKNILDSNGYYKNDFDFDKVLFRVPIKLWVYCDNLGGNGLSDSEIKCWMTDLNMYNISNNTGFLYYLRDVERVKNSNRQIMGYYIEANWAQIFNKTSNCLNIHIVKAIKRKFLLGRASTALRGLYNGFTRSILVREICPSTTLAHEIGHYFGLYHPHRNHKKGRCKQEAVNRTRKFKGCLFKSGLICEKSGDGLCDTPAEPDLRGSVDTSCRYIGNAFDKWGDYYYPNTDNIMSYPEHVECRQKFTAGQIGVMIHYANEMKISGWNAKDNSNKQYIFDKYEPDYNKETASYISLNSSQKHTFHKKFVSKKKQDLDKDIDWVKFEIPEKNISLEIETQKGKYLEADTEIVLFDEYDTEIARNNNRKKSKFSKISLKNLRVGWYFLKIIKHNSSSKNEILDYKLSIKTIEVEIK